MIRQLSDIRNLVTKNKEIVTEINKNLKSEIWCVFTILNFQRMLLITQSLQRRFRFENWCTSVCWSFPVLQLDCSTLCDLEAQKAWNSRCGAATDHQNYQNGLGGTHSEPTRLRGPSGGDRIALCLQIKHPIQKLIKILKFVSGTWNVISEITYCACLPLFLFVGWDDTR